MKGKGLWRSCACIHLRRVRVRVDESTHRLLGRNNFENHGCVQCTLVSE